jgi:hypothetical protein
MIPVLDLKAQYAAIEQEIDAAIKEVLLSGQFIRSAELTAKPGAGRSGTGTEGGGLLRVQVWGRGEDGRGRMEGGEWSGEGGAVMVEQMIYPIRVHEVATKGQRIFRQLSEKLEEEHLGEAVAIEVDRGDYFLGKTGLEAVRKARERHPGKLFFVGRAGQPAYVSFRPRRTRQWGNDDEQ